MKSTGAPGSALVLVLMVCLGAAVMILAVGAAIGVRADALRVEQDGRRDLTRVERGLSELSRVAADFWAPAETQLEDDGTGSLADIPGATGRVLMAEARVPTREGTMGASARLESGKDGVTLPRRVVAARALWAGASRVDPGVGIDPDGGVDGGVSDAAVDTTLAEDSSALSATVVPPPASLLGPGVTADPAPRAWVMDPGTAALVESAPTQGAAGFVGLAAGVPLLAALTAETGRQPETPALIIGDRSAPVNACGLGDLYAVILAGSGGVDLEGTIVHGAVFTEGDVRLGETGKVLFREGVWTWATEGSLIRVRLVRGTRTESFEASTP